jgi:hypothetical protein
MPTSDTSRSRLRAVPRLVGAALAAGIAGAMLIASPAYASEARDYAARPTQPEYVMYFPPMLMACLVAAADPDSMYPGIDPSEVKHCLAG